MKTYTKEQVREAMRKLPDLVVEQLGSDLVIDAILEVSRAYKLHIDQQGFLSSAITYTMLGLEPSGKFVQNIQEALGVKQDIANNIAHDINTAIFEPLKYRLSEQTAEVLHREEERGAKLDADEFEVPSREDILREIEDAPEPIKAPVESNVPVSSISERAPGLAAPIAPANLPILESGAQEVPLISPVASTAAPVVEQPAVVTHAASPIAQKLAASTNATPSNAQTLKSQKPSDPYREPVA